MSTQAPAGRAAATLALRVLRNVVAGLAVDGKVSLQDIDRAIGLMQRGTVELDKAFENNNQKGAVQDAEMSLIAIAEAEIEEEKDSTPKQNRAGMRSDPVHRLLALPFEPMFFSKPPGLERKYLSGYFSTSRKLIGPVFIAYDAECKAIIESLLPAHGKNLSWEVIYAEPRTISLMRRLFGTMSNKLHTSAGMEIWTSMMVTPAADGSVLSREKMSELREVILTFLRGLPAAA